MKIWNSISVAMRDGHSFKHSSEIIFIVFLFFIIFYFFVTFHKILLIIILKAKNGKEKKSTLNEKDRDQCTFRLDKNFFKCDERDNDFLNFKVIDIWIVIPIHETRESIVFRFFFSFVFIFKRKFLWNKFVVIKFYFNFGWLMF